MAYSKIALPFKDPNEVLDYVLSWVDRLDGDTILTSAWSFAVDPDSLLIIDSESETATTTTVWLSGGTIGESYELTNRITTAGGRTMDQTAKIKIRAK